MFQLQIIVKYWWAYITFLFCSKTFSNVCVFDLIKIVSSMWPQLYWVHPLLVNNNVSLFITAKISTYSTTTTTEYKQNHNRKRMALSWALGINEKAPVIMPCLQAEWGLRCYNSSCRSDSVFYHENPETKQNSWFMTQEKWLWEIIRQDKEYSNKEDHLNECLLWTLHY